ARDEAGDAGAAAPDGLAHRDWRDGRAAEALRLERLHDEGELVDLLGRQLVELEVLQQVDTVDHQHDLVDRQRDLRVWVGRDLDPAALPAGPATRPPPRLCPGTTCRSARCPWPRAGSSRC